MTKLEFFNVLTDDERMIRSTVFVEEQGFNEEFDTIDNGECTHIVLYSDGKPAGCIRFFAGENVDEIHFGRLAVLKNFRGQHYGKMLVKEVERCAVERGAKIVALSAQLRVSEFYEKLGYTKSGEIYLDEHCEHIHMEKKL